jgi:hypothetical protein
MNSTKKLTLPWMTRERLRSVALAHSLNFLELNAPAEALSEEQLEMMITKLKPLVTQVSEVASLIRELNYYRCYGEN